jgi:hypothetical protein
LVHCILVARETGIKGFEVASAIDHTPVAVHGIEMLLSECATIELERTIEHVLRQEAMGPIDVVQLAVV